jgi:hypothetical protein
MIRKVFKVGDSRVISLPPEWCRDAKYVAIKLQDGALLVQRVDVR